MITVFLNIVGYSFLISVVFVSISALLYYGVTGLMDGKPTWRKVLGIVQIILALTLSLTGIGCLAYQAEKSQTVERQ